MRIFINDIPYADLQAVVAQLGTPTNMFFKDTSTYVTRIVILFERRDVYIEVLFDPATLLVSTLTTDYPFALSAGLPQSGQS